MLKSTTLLLVTVMLLAASVAVANPPDLDNCTAVIAPGGEGSVLYNCIDGAGFPFTMAHLPDGAVVDATITLTLLDDFGHPIPNIPAESCWLETSGGDLVFPANGTIADGPTDANGQTQWQQPLRAGGCSLGETVIVLVEGQPLNQPGLDLAFVSADINGNLVVNLADLSAFAAAYTAGYAACADLFVDGVINLSDLSVFSQVYGQ